MPREVTPTAFGELREEVSEHLGREEFYRVEGRITTALNELRADIERLRQAITALAIQQERQSVHGNQLGDLQVSYKDLAEKYVRMSERVTTLATKFAMVGTALAIGFGAVQFWMMVHK